MLHGREREAEQQMDYPSRSTLGASRMITQSFLYNAIFFTYTLVLTKIYGVNAKSAP